MNNNYRRTIRFEGILFKICIKISIGDISFVVWIKKYIDLYTEY